MRGHAGDRVALEQDLALAWRHQPHDGFQRRRFADAVAAEQSNHFAGANRERDAVQDVALAVIGVNILDQDERLGAGGCGAHVLR